MADTQTHQSLSEAVRTVVSSSPVSEAPTVISSVPDDERAQQILTPAQQLAMRDEVKKCKSVNSAVEVIHQYIWKVPDGAANEIDTDPELSDRPLTETQLLEIIKPNTARAFTGGILAKMNGLRNKVRNAETTEAKLDHLADLTVQTGYLSLIAVAVDTEDEKLLRLSRGRKR